MARVELTQELARQVPCPARVPDLHAREERAVVVKLVIFDASGVVVADHAVVALIRFDV